MNGSGLSWSRGVLCLHSVDQTICPICPNPTRPAGPPIPPTPHKRLDALAKQLNPAEIEHEPGLRSELVAVNGRRRMDRCEMGRILASYRLMYKPRGKWHAFCKAVGLNERSALRIIADYTAAKALPQSIREAAESNPETLEFASRQETPLSRRNLLNRQLKPTSEKLGLKGANWHWPRHANATLLDAVGARLVTVQALLGHASAEITREVSLHAVPANAKSVVQKVEDLIGPKRIQVPVWPEPMTLVTQWFFWDYWSGREGLNLRSRSRIRFRKLLKNMEIWNF